MSVVKKIRPVLMVVFLLLCAVSISTINKKVASAGTLSDISVSVSDSTELATSSLTLNLTNQTALSAYAGRIQFQIYGPNAWPNTSMNLNNATINTTESSSSSFYIYSYDWNGLTIRNSQTISANTSMKIVLDNVVNPSLGGYYYAHVWTGDMWSDLDGSIDPTKNYNSPYFEIGDNTNLKGTINDNEGAPMPYAQVSIWAGSAYYSTYTDANGKYGLADVPNNTYNFQVSYYSWSSTKTYFPPDLSTATVTSGQVTTKDASFLAPDKMISGKVTRNSASGSAVTDATIYAYKSSGNGSIQTNTDAYGNYSFYVTSGLWVVYVYPLDYSKANWTISNDYQSIDVRTDNKTKNFIVDTLSSTITGSIKKSDTSTVGQYDANLNFNNSKSQYFNSWLSGTANSDGSRNFTVKVTPSTYSVTGWSSDNNYAFPSISNFSVGDGETYNLGVIELTKKTDRIQGTVKDNFDDPVIGASVSAWKSAGGYDYGYATTGTDGSYTIMVVPGTWQISVWGPYNSNTNSYDYISSGKTTEVKVVAGTPEIKNFILQKATSTITGVIKDPTTKAMISNLYGSITAGDGSTDWGNIWGSIQNGRYTIKVPAGTWTLRVMVWMGDYSNPESQIVTIGDNESKTVDFTLIKNDAIISGTIYTGTPKDRTALKNTWVSVYASKGSYGNWQNGTVDTATGNYSIKVSEGTWNLGWWVDQSLGYSSGDGQDIELKIASSEIKDYDIYLKKLDSTISGTAKDSNGNPIKWAWISADSRDPNKKTTAYEKSWSNGASSNTSGEFTLKVPAGTYWVGGNMWYGSGYINPKKEQITVDADNPVTGINLVFREADAKITGKVTKSDSAVSAFVNGWSEDGGYTETNAGNDGNYELAVSSGSTWHIKAMRKDGDDVYKSKEHLIDLSDTKTASEDLSLYKMDYTLPENLTMTFDPSQQQSITLNDGTTLNMPANSITSEAGNVTLTTEAVVDLAEEIDAKPLAYGYEFNITDSNGQAIETFNSNITVEQVYEEGWLEGDELNTQAVESGEIVTVTSNAGSVINENELSPAYYDTSVGTWKDISNTTVNEDQNVVSYQVNHFTKFALVSATDTTPPSAPTGQTATAGNGKITLGWTNPADEDFASINIYRSTVSGNLGEKVHSGITGTSKDDESLTNGTLYYYTIKAADASGNESINSTQVSATPSENATNATAETVASQTLPKTGDPSGKTGYLSVIVLLSAIFVDKLRALKI